MSNEKSFSRTVAILGYHKIGDHPPDGWPTWSYVPESSFAEQLHYLNENDWQVISLNTFLNGLVEPDTLPERAVLITFDDGYRSNLEVALPLLQRFSFPGALFVPTAFIGGYNAFDADIFYEPREPICTWEELRQLDQQGVAVQSHGFSHRHFSKLSLTEQVAEAVQSKTLLEDRLGKRIDAFSFPYGDDGLDPAQTESILKEAGYKAAFLYEGGFAEVLSERSYRLARIPVGSDTDIRLVLESKVPKEQ